MAQDQQNQNNLNSAKTNTYQKGLIKDYNDTFVPEGVWINAINAVTNSHLGDTGTIGNEPSNVYCVDVAYTIIGIVRRDSDVWVVFSTNNVLSEIGYFTESTCSYTSLINDKCLNFDKSYLITGFVQYNFDCSWSIFFADGLNPDRTINLNKPPYLFTWDTTNPACPLKVFSECLDCELIRLNYLVTPPCVEITKAKGAGSLLNGSYQAVVAYTINGQRVTNYFTPSNIQSIWNHMGVAGGLEITVSSIDIRFEEFELVIVSTVASQSVARKIGTYSTSQSKIYIDNYSEANVSVDLTLIPLVTPIYEKSNKMFSLTGYLLRSGVRSKYDFNYQPLANQIGTYWQEVEYSANYYQKGGYNTSYLRDEQYAFFIRFIYNDGDKSASYHIPGRAPVPTDLTVLSGTDVLTPTQNKAWQVYNTATVTNTAVNTRTFDNGLITREGLMGYWESVERYPINRPEVWADLCGQNIRHHKFPDNAITHIHNQGGDKIYLLGVKFENIQPPVDNQGNIILNIIGFEILRSSREGNRTIIAKGLINNMREYSNTSGSKVLYQNYPYNDLRPDRFLRTSLGSDGNSVDSEGSPLSGYKKDYFSFHSPDTNFNKPFLSYDEVKVYTREYGSTLGVFQNPYGQPKQKLVTNLAYTIGLIVGLGIGLKAAFGNTTQAAPDIVSSSIGAGVISTTFGGGVTNPNAITLAGLASTVAPITGITSSNFGVYGFTNGFGNTTAASFPTVTQTGGDFTALDITGLIPYAPVTNPLVKAGVQAALILKFIDNISYYGGQGIDQAIRLIKASLPYRQYALQFNSHGYYSNYIPVSYQNSPNNTRREHITSIYTKDQIQSFDVTYGINNLYRNDFVTLNVKGTFQDVSTGNSSIEDKTRQRIRDTGLSHSNPTEQPVTATTSAYYAGLKVDLENQYGQLEGVVQLPIQPCFTQIETTVLDKVYSSGILFGGDIYINRYTEKNPFFYFTQWLFNLPEGTDFNYKEYSNPLYPRYWANFEDFDASGFDWPSWDDLVHLRFGSVITYPSSYHYLDRDNSSSGFLVKNGWFYLFNNGIRDFFVESEVNLAYRDYGDIIAQRHYDYTLYTDYNRLFRTDIIEAGNYYKYDYSLSVSKLLSNYVSFSAILPRYYDPTVAETCYAYYPKRVLYSLPQQSEQLRDSWRIYLTNNYKDFENVISVIKPINRTGSLILFEDAEPTSVTGVDQLQTSSGTKITIGDGGLFAQPFQSLVNADDEYEYASCQDTRAVINTPYGVFWMSRSTGKVLNYTGGSISDIAMNGMRYWFAKYLPNILTIQYPGFTAIENTVIGIGCLATYDTQYEIVYFTKRDFKAYPNVFLNEETQEFYIKRQSGNIIIELGDPNYFENCSWTISYDPKTKMWLSFHDWQPNHLIGTNDHFYSIKDRGFWKHNITCSSYCNFYGVNYPFEVEFPVNTGSTVNTIKNIEYTLEVLTYPTDCIDPYNVLNANFDYAMIYNAEQNSGWLRLNLAPQNPTELLKYPIVLTDSVEIAYSKVENKYRFNQFWDATKDRGQVSGNQFRMFNTEQNGYRKVLNDTYIDYTKSPLQRKRFRHYGNRVILGKAVSDNLKLNLKVVNTKETLSPR